MKKYKNLIIAGIISVISVLIGIIFDGGLLGTISLTIGFINAYFMSEGKWYSYVFGLIFSILYCYICFLNGLYGAIIVSFIFYIPSQIVGLIKWFNKKGKDSVVLLRAMKIKQAIFLVLSVSVSSFIFGYFLTFIPSQNIAFLDATAQMINIPGTVLAILRYRESWYVWIVNNVLDLSIWIYCFVTDKPNSLMMLLVSIMYLFMNIYGVVSWIKIEKKQKEENGLNF